MGSNSKAWVMQFSSLAFSVILGTQKEKHIRELHSPKSRYAQSKNPNPKLAKAINPMMVKKPNK